MLTSPSYPLLSKVDLTMILSFKRKSVNRKNHNIFNRLKEYFQPKGLPWFRGLWQIGSISSLKEVLEVSKAVNGAIIHGEHLKEVQVFTIKRISNDDGISLTFKNSIKTLLGGNRNLLAFRGCNYYVLLELIAELEKIYVTEWMKLLGCDNDVSTERAARYLACHFLDSGYSSQFLYQQCLTSEKKHTKVGDALFEFLSLLHVPHAEDIHVYEVLFVFTKTRSIKGEHDGEHASMSWLDAQEVSKWLRSQKHTTKGLRFSGGMKVSVRAKDIHSAIYKAIYNSRSVIYRISLGTKQSPELLNRVWVAGFSQSFKLPDVHREIHLKVIDKEGLFFKVSENESVENGIALVGFMNEAPASPAVTAGWAAIESLLVGPGDGSKAIAADRVADIVVCSYSRAELTKLAYRYLELDHKDKLSDILVSQKENSEKALLFGEALKKDQIKPFENCVDKLAKERICKVVTNPEKELALIQEHVRETMLRLYRQRNCVMHGGLVASEYLETSLRTSVPIIGACLDRIAQASYVQHKNSLVLAAHAKKGLLLIDGATIEYLIHLLD